MVAEKKLTPKEEAFCRHYIGCKFNATRAAKMAGYSGASAAAIGSENLRKPHIWERLQELGMNDVIAPEITPERTMEELAKIGYGDGLAPFLGIDINGGLVPDFSDASYEELRMLTKVKTVTRARRIPGEEEPVEAIETTVETYNRKDALSVLGRFQGLDKVNVAFTVEEMTAEQLLALQDRIRAQKAAQAATVEEEPSA